MDGSESRSAHAAEIYRSFMLDDKRWQEYFSRGKLCGRLSYPISVSSNRRPPPTVPPMIQHIRRPSSMLDKFPVELLFLVKDHIPEIDLRTHVCFAQVLGCASKTVYTDAYWERACVKFGLTISSDEDIANVSWRDFVYDIIRRDGFCTHPHCGVRRLEQNCAYLFVSFL